MHIIPFKAEHAVKMMGNAIEPMEVENAEAIAEEYHRGGPAFSAVNDEGDIVGSAGVKMIAPGVGHAWAIADRDLIRTIDYGWLYKVIGEYLTAIIKNNNLRRVQGDCVSGAPVLEHFITKIGFKKEGILRKFGVNGEDYIFFSIVDEDVK
jgi:hypothetical protein